MRTQNVQDSNKAPERSAAESSEQALRSKTNGVGKAKRKTRRGKRGGVKRRMQNLKREQKMLESLVGELIKDIRHKMEAPQSGHAPSRDVIVDVLTSDPADMSVTPRSTT